MKAEKGARLKLVGVDLFNVSKPTLHVASKPASVAQKYGQDLPFMFIVNLMIPGPPFYCVACYFSTLQVAVMIKTWS